ncbi:hypothetical protein V6Z12_D12G219800 [Gossypium hirsutum]
MSIKRGGRLNMISIMKRKLKQGMWSFIWSWVSDL